MNKMKQEKGWICDKGILRNIYHYIIYSYYLNCYSVSFLMVMNAMKQEKVKRGGYVTKRYLGIS